MAGHRTRFLPIFVVLGLIVLVVYGFDWWTTRQSKKQWDEYYELTKLDEKERAEKLVGFHAKYPNSRSGYFSALQVADHHFKLAKDAQIKEGAANDAGLPDAAKAREWYEKAMQFTDLMPTERQLLLINQGNAVELEKKWAEAEALYQKAADVQAADAKGLALLNAGRVQELKGEDPKAIETYQRVSTENSSSEYGRLAKNALRRLKSPMLRGEKKG